jgi:hypothetical protein
MPHDPNEPNVLFDRVAWRRHRERAACQGAVEFLHVETSERLLDRLDDIALSFPTILDLGVHGSALSSPLIRLRVSCLGILALRWPPIPNCSRLRRILLILRSVR